MAITPEAFQALQALHDGARYNIMHTIARELIDAGLAHSGFGILEITEAGRIWVRRGVQPVNQPRSYIVDDPDIANLGASNQVEKINTREERAPQEPFVFAPEPPPQSETLPPAPLTDTSLAWSRARAIAAAGAASGVTDHWPPPDWITSFMDAYEGC